MELYSAFLKVISISGLFIKYFFEKRKNQECKLQLAKNKQMKNKNSKHESFSNLLYFSVITQFFLVLSGAIASAQQYDTIQWNTLKNYKTPEWFQDAKFGIYPHLGDRKSVV